MKIKYTLLILFISCSILNAQNLNQGLIAWYPYDGNANDYSGNNNNGVLSGPTPTVDRFNNPNSAYYLDGNDQIDILNAVTLNPTAAISISAWYHAVSFTGAGSGPIFTKGFYSHTAPYYQYKIGVTGNLYAAPKFIFYVTANGVLSYTNTALNSYTPGNWYHLVGSYDGTVTRLYMNGTLAASVAASGSITTFTTNCRVGNNTTAPDYLTGSVDDTRLYNRSLTPQEITALYCGPPAPASVVGNNTVCPGGTLNYSVPAVAGASSYTWTLPLGWTGTSNTNTISVQTGTNTGTITVAGTNSCGTGPYSALTVTVFPSPTPNTPIGANPACISTSQTYSVAPVVGAVSYTWSIPAGWTGTSTTNSISVQVGLTSGTVAVAAINNTCGTSPFSSLNVTAIHCPNGIAEEQNNFLKLKLLPNPSDEFIVLYLESDAIKKIEVNLSNHLGQLVYSEKNLQPSESGIKINTQHLAPGIYLMNVVSGERSVSQKIIVMH